MRHNVKTRLWTIALLAALAAPASAQGPAPLEATVADLAAAGVADAAPVAPAADRFGAPVRYFRSPERLSDADAKKDCADCADLIAAYAAETATVPSWHAEKSQQFVKVGGRLQLRTYLPAAKRVIIVTAVNETTLRKVSARLVAKFSE